MSQYGTEREMWYVKLAKQALFIVYRISGFTAIYTYSMCWYSILLYRCKDHRGQDRMVAAFTTTYVMSTYHH